MAFTIQKAKTVHKKSKIHQVDLLQDNYYRVTSGASSNQYLVRLENDQSAICSCPWSKYRPTNDKRCACSHVQSVMTFRQNNLRTTSAWKNSTDAHRQHRPMINLGDGVIMTTRKVRT